MHTALMLSILFSTKIEIGLITKPCSTPVLADSCDCQSNTLANDSNIVFYTTELGTPYHFEYYKNCFRTTLSIYGQRVNLDSIYMANIINKDLVYAAGFVEGTYQRKADNIVVELTFINGAINSSRSTAHKFIIVYNIKTRKAARTWFKFLPNR